jgi:hypothetical protein
MRQPIQLFLVAITVMLATQCVFADQDRSSSQQKQKNGDVICQNRVNEFTTPGNQHQFLKAFQDHGTFHTHHVVC